MEFTGPKDMEAAFEQVFWPNGQLYRGAAKLTVIRNETTLTLEVVDFEEQRLRASPEALGGETGYFKR